MQGCLENCQDLSYSAPVFKVTQKVILMPKNEKCLFKILPVRLIQIQCLLEQEITLERLLFIIVNFR